MKKIFRCVTVARSGSHAIYNWIEQQFICCNGKNIKKNRQHMYFNTINKLKDIDIVVDNYEDLLIRDFVNKYRSSYKCRYGRDENGRRRFVEIPFLKEREKIDVIVLRDPFNLFASRSRQKATRRNDRETALFISDVWKSHAREVLGDTNYCENKICVIYNKWFKDIEYRKDISAKLGGIISDKGINKMAQNGRGSSFNRKNKHFEKNAQEMDTLCRWKYFLKKDKYSIYKKNVLPIFKDEELINLSERIFGHIDGTEKIYR